MGEQDTIDFEEIDANPLSQMFKAKILSLYFPERFLNICSTEHIEDFASMLQLRESQHTSELQHLLALAKQQNAVAKTWSNPKFMEYLFNTYRNVEPASATLHPPRKKTHRLVNFEDMQTLRDAIGKTAEEFALTWERRRLEGATLQHLIPAIKDCRDRPGHGYDFLSHSSQNEIRFIEVKSVGKRDGGYRFFLSENEQTVSKSATNQRRYFFYLVYFDGKGSPFEVDAVLASELYGIAKIVPASYMVQFARK